MVTKVPGLNVPEGFVPILHHDRTPALMLPDSDNPNEYWLGLNGAVYQGVQHFEPDSVAFGKWRIALQLAPEYFDFEEAIKRIMAGHIIGVKDGGATYTQSSNFSAKSIAYLMHRKFYVIEGP